MVDILATNHILNGFAIKELVVLSQFPHPNIISVLDRWLPDAPNEQNNLVITMPKAGCSLLEMSQTVAKENISGQALDCIIASILMDSASALAHLHSHKIFHGDLKPENLLYSRDTGRTTLIDFGAAIVCASARQSHEIGCTYMYESYETLKPASTPQFNEFNDVWSIGVIVFTLLLGHHPNWTELPSASDPKKTIEHGSPEYRAALYDFLHKIHNEKPFLCFLHMFGKDHRFSAAVARYKSLCPELQNILCRMLYFSAEERPTMQDVANSCQSILSSRCKVERVRCPPQPRMDHRTPITLDYMTRLNLPLSCRRAAILRLWDHIISREKAKGRSESMSSGIYAFVLGIHIFERYCCLRKKTNISFTEYLASAFLGYHLACSLIFIHFPPLDLSFLHVEPDTVSSSPTAAAARSSLNTPSMGRFLFRMREMAVEMLMLNGGMLLENTFYDIHTMPNAMILMEIVSSPDYYTLSHSYLRERYIRRAHNFAPRAWYEGDIRPLTPVSLSTDFSPSDTLRDLSINPPQHSPTHSYAASPSASASTILEQSSPPMLSFNKRFVFAPMRTSHTVSDSINDKSVAVDHSASPMAGFSFASASPPIAAPKFSWDAAAARQHALQQGQTAFHHDTFGISNIQNFQKQ
jgi:serine/threonine protein kinase